MLLSFFICLLGICSSCAEQSSQINARHPSIQDRQLEIAKWHIYISAVEYMGYSCPSERKAFFTKSLLNSDLKLSHIQKSDTGTTYWFQLVNSAFTHFTVTEGAACDFICGVSFLKDDTLIAYGTSYHNIRHEYYNYEQVARHRENYPYLTDTYIATTLKKRQYPFQTAGPKFFTYLRNNKDHLAPWLRKKAEEKGYL